MPRTIAGSDFLESLNELFEEVSHKGFSGSDSFASVRKKVVTLLLMVSKTTAAKARASCPVLLPDGSEPGTYIQLPPSTFKIDMPLGVKLDDATDPAEFIKILTEAFEDQRAQRTRGKNNSRKRKKIAEADGSSPSTPRKKIILRTTRTEPITPSPAAVSPSPEDPQQSEQQFPSPPVPQQPRELEQLFPSPPATEAEPQMDLDQLAGPAEMNIQKGDKAIMSPLAFIKKATQATAPRPQQDIVRALAEEARASHVPRIGSPLVQLKTQSQQDCQETDDDATDRDYILDGATTDDAMSVDELPIGALVDTLQGELVSEAGSKPDYTPEEADAAAQMREILDEMSMITSDEWESYRPKLFDSLQLVAEREEAKLRSLGPMAAKSSLTRLDGAIAHLASDIALVPAANWRSYEKKLRQLCNSPVFFTYDFRQRLWKIMDLMFLPEEAEVIECGQWDRLEAVAKIVGTIAESIGPVEENASELAYKWFDSKIRDIRFLEKLMTSIKRKDAILRPNASAAENRN
ncbi:hypothetical protein PT974_12042 [Cladobotryum mycophilum]|uniref:Uncharacterized protein n=1 Tax=Cladobotryum mycophilum TaxID=491253 RepID=A0ABR0S8D6_9HYPO